MTQSHNESPQLSHQKNEAAETSWAKPAVGPLDYLAYPFFVLSFLGCLLFFDLVQRLALLVSPKMHLRSVCWLNSSLVACLQYTLQTKITLSGSLETDPSRPFNRPCIVIANHQSLFDIPLIHSLFKTRFPKFISKKELAKWIPSVSFNLRHGGNAIIDRSNSRQAIPEIKRLGERTAAENLTVVIFPEGTRAREGKLKEFKAAGLSTLIQLAELADIIPLAIDNSWKLASRKFGPIPRNIELKLSILPALNRQGKSPKELVLEAHNAIAMELDRLRS